MSKVSRGDEQLNPSPAPRWKAALPYVSSLLAIMVFVLAIGPKNMAKWWDTGTCVMTVGVFAVAVLAKLSKSELLLAIRTSRSYLYVGALATAAISLVFISQLTEFRWSAMYYVGLPFVYATAIDLVVINPIAQFIGKRE